MTIDTMVSTEKTTGNSSKRCTNIEEKFIPYNGRNGFGQIVSVLLPTEVYKRLQEKQNGAPINIVGEGTTNIGTTYYISPCLDVFPSKSDFDSYTDWC